MYVITAPNDVIIIDIWWVKLPTALQRRARPTENHIQGI